MDPKKKSTIMDVARRANVSRQTVSRVLANSELVAEATRQRVRSAIRELYYRPDPVARSLVNRRTYLIGVVITEFTGYTRDRILSGAGDEAQRHNYNLFICAADAGRNGEPVDARLLNRQRYEAVLILYRGAESDQYRLFEQIPGEIPVVTIGYNPPREHLTRIVSTDRDGAYCATRHLLDLGHRRIATLTGNPGRYDVNERRDGYRAALEEAGIPLDSELELDADWTPAGAYETVERSLRRGLRFSGLFCQSDLMAIGAISAIRTAGFSVPRDVSVVGFDNIDIGKYIDPPLTSVDQQIYETGRIAIQALIDRIEGSDARPRTIELSTELVMRDSTCWYSRAGSVNAR